MAELPHDRITTHPEYARAYHHYVQQGAEPETAGRLAYEHTQNHLGSNLTPAVRPPSSKAARATLVTALVGAAALFGSCVVLGAILPSQDTAQPTGTQSEPVRVTTTRPPTAVPPTTAAARTSPTIVRPTSARPTTASPRALAPLVSRQPAPALSVRILSLPATGQGNRVTATVKTASGAVCSIEVTYKSGPSKAAGLGRKTASSSGRLTWTWLVGTRTTPGDWPVTVTCQKGSASHSDERELTVRDTGRPG